MANSQIVERDGKRFVRIAITGVAEVEVPADKQDKQARVEAFRALNAAKVEGFQALLDKLVEMDFYNEQGVL